MAMNPHIKDIGLELGAKPGAIKHWKRRGKVAHSYRLPILKAARDKGIALSEDDFDFTPAEERAQA